MNTYLRDVTRQLQGHSADSKPFAIVYSAAANSLTTGVFTTLAFDTVDVNRGGLWTGAGFVVPSGWAGWYTIKAGVDIDIPAGNKEIRISINGVEEGIAAQNAVSVLEAPVRLQVSGDAWLAEGDTIDSIVFQDHPIDISTVGGPKTRLSAMWNATDN